MSHSLHPLLAGSWSPTSFDPSHEIAQDEIELLLQAGQLRKRLEIVRYRDDFRSRDVVDACEAGAGGTNDSTVTTRVIDMAALSRSAGDGGRGVPEDRVPYRPRGVHHFFT